MFALQYESGFLDLVKGENPTIEWISTAFNNSEELLGSFSYPIELADTPNNDRLLNFSGQLAARSARVDIEVTPHLLGVPWKRCTFSYDLEDGNRKGYLKIDNGAFASVIKEKELPTVFIKVATGGEVDHDWIYVGNDLATTKQAVNDSLTPLAASYTFFPYINEGIFGSEPKVEDNWDKPHLINPWRSTGFVDATTPDTIKKIWYSPSLYLTWVIQKVCTYLGYEAEGDFMNDPFIRSLVIPNNGIYHLNDLFAATGFKLAPARHLPKIKITEFFKALREEFRLIYYFNSDTRKASFTLSDTVLSSPERVELDGCIEKKKPGTKKQPESGYELVQGFDDADEHFKIFPYVRSFFIGDYLVPKKVELPIGTCFMLKEINVQDPGLPTWRIPAMKQTGNAYSERAINATAHNPQDYGRNNFKLRLLSYQGMKPDSLGNLYPYACSDGLAPDGETNITQSLWLGGEEGILSRYHKNWYIFYLLTEQTMLRAQMPNAVLSQLSPLKKIRWSTEEGIALEAMISKVIFTADAHSRLLKAELTVYPIYNQAAVALPEFTFFLPGDRINEDLIFAKLVEENEIRENRGWPFSKFLKSRHADLVVYFYYDKEMTIPYITKGLQIKILRKYRGYNAVSYRDDIFYYTASGHRFVIGENLELFYLLRDTQRNWHYSLLENGDKYKLI